MPSLTDRKSPFATRFTLLTASLFILLLTASTTLLASPATPPVHQHPAPSAAPAGSFFDLFKVYVPRQQCMNYEQDVIWTHVIADAAIALSYYSIPLALIYFVRKRRDLAFDKIFYLFAIFILACGTTHVLSILAIWYPLYRLDGVVKAITAFASIVTAIVLWPLIPKALRIPSQSQLKLANLQLAAEVAKTRQAEDELLTHRDQLEERVKERTAELAQANDSLRAEVVQREKMEVEREILLKSERAARENSDRANQMKDEFLATLSHELRTPINSICGWTHLLQMSRKRSPEEIAEGLAVIDRSARVQTRLIDDLLDMSRIISGKIQLEIEAVELATVIEAAMETTKPAADAKDIKITCTAESNASLVMGDEARLQQVIWNLLSNAVKFTPKGGSIRVQLQRTQSLVAVSIEDNGQGIRADLLPYVFDRFRQGDSTTTRRHGGLGLGLAIVKSLIELHGGTVLAESPGEGKGSTFSFKLPISALRREAAGTGTSSPERIPSWMPGALTGVSVLLVDDEPESRRVVRRALEDHLALVTEASSAVEAMEAFLKQKPTVLISDIGMPDEDGYSLIRRVRALRAEDGGQVPAIALTAFARKEDRLRTLSAGYQMHLSKPVEMMELLTVISNMAHPENTH